MKEALRNLRKVCLYISNASLKVTSSAECQMNSPYNQPNILSPKWMFWLSFLLKLDFSFYLLVGFPLVYRPFDLVTSSLLSTYLNINWFFLAGYLKFGFYREEDGIVYREWAPAAQ